MLAISPTSNGVSPSTSLPMTGTIDRIGKPQTLKTMVTARTPTSVGEPLSPARPSRTPENTPVVTFVNRPGTRGRVPARTMQATP